jgi:signal transduction histidine kinase
VERFWRVAGAASDWVAAAVLTVAALAELGGGASRSPLTVAAALVTTLSVGWRSRAPMAAALVASAGYAAFELSSGSGRELVEPAALVFVFYTVGRRSVAGRRPLFRAAALVVGSLGVSVLTRGSRSVFDEAAGWMLFVAVPLALGRALASRSAVARRLQATTEALAQENEARAQRAAAEERMRIARELHDVVAHSVSVMVVQTAAARRVAPTDREAAREALRMVESCGRDALVEMRRVIGVLRRGDAELSGAVSPTLGELESLIGRARSAGLTVNVQVRGRSREVAPDVDVVAFRVVQEALTNAIKHAGPVEAQVVISYGEQALELEISDSGPAAAAPPVPGGGGGHGLAGMQERLALYGGRLLAGPMLGGGFQVRASIPLHAPVGA